MDVDLKFHVEPADGHFVWWVEAEQLPGLTASADGLPELRSVLVDVLRDLSDEAGEEILVRSEELVGAEARWHPSPDIVRQGETPATCRPDIRVRVPA